MSEETQESHLNIKYTTLSDDAYRSVIRDEIGGVGIVALMDTINDIEELLHMTKNVVWVGVDILIEEVRNYLDERYG